jgi:hypothetical protein
MANYAGLSLRDIYAKKCEEMHCKRNSQFYLSLPSKPDLFEVPSSIDLSQNFVGPKGLVALMEVVRCCTGLTSLNLRDQQMSNESVFTICSVVARHPTLIKLDLSNNPLTISGGAALIELTKNNPVLEEIVLDNTDIKGAMKTAIQAQLARNKRSKGPQGSGAAADGEPSANGAAVDSADQPTRVMDSSIVRSTLAGIPTSVDNMLFDDNPLEELVNMCRRFDASFYDPQFPPEAVSVQRVVTVDYGDAKWQRLVNMSFEREGEGKVTPKLYPEDDSMMVLPREARASFSWLFTCVGAALNPAAIRQLITPNTINPFGVYTVRFHIDGKPRYVVVDDNLPVDEKGKLIFAQPSRSEFVWPLILEKAVAKLHGGYQALDLSVKMRHPVEKRLSASTVMCDLTGGVGISRDLHHEEFNSTDWWNTLVELSDSKSTSLVANSIKEDETAAKELGIIPSHAYQILHARQINGFKLLCLCGRWAKERKWIGEWSDQSPLWDQYPHITSALGFRTKDANSFWIPYVKFLQLFSAVHICRVFPDTQARLIEGSWTPATAGGAYFDPAWTENPRYKLTLTERGKLFLNLSLPDERFNDSGLDALAFHVFRSSTYPVKYDKEALIAKTSYVITNSVSYDGVFEEGDYWIVPSTYAAGKTGNFLIKIFSTSPFIIRHENLRSYWKFREEVIDVESSGEYQNGEDNPQLALSVAQGEQPAKVLIRLHVPQSEQLNLALFLVHNPRPGRVLGPIPEENIMARSKFVISNTVSLEVLLPGGNTNYVIVPCINPEGTSTRAVFSIWSAQADVTVERLPLWFKKSVTCIFESSAGYQDSTNNPQLELITPIPNQTFVVSMTVTQCSDPSLTFFIVNNRGRTGEGIRGKIPDEKIVCKAPYVRYHAVIKDFSNGPNPADSYIIVPSLQPPGSSGRCIITVTSDSEVFQLHTVLPG